LFEVHAGRSVFRHIVTGHAVIEKMVDAADGGMQDDERNGRKEGQDSEPFHPARCPGVWL
jgi:hypothetical protein